MMALRASRRSRESRDGKIRETAGLPAIPAPPSEGRGTAGGTLIWWCFRLLAITAVLGSYF